MGDAQPENERSSAFQWLLDDPNGRAISSPTELDAVLNMLAARDAHPSETFTRQQFVSPRLTTGRETRFIGYHGFTLL